METLLSAHGKPFQGIVGLRPIMTLHNANPFHAIRQCMPTKTLYVYTIFLSVMTRHQLLLIALGLCMAQFFIFTNPVQAGQLKTLDTKDASIFYEQPLSGPAQEIAGLFPSVRNELEISLGFPVDFRPAIILVSNETAFEQIVGNRLDCSLCRAG